MNWTDFFLYLALFYVVYYAVNVVIDVLRTPHRAKSQERPSYAFQSDLSEFDEKPMVVEEEDLVNKSTPKPEKAASTNTEGQEEKMEFKETNPIKSTGGVTNLDSLFALAKENTIEMKKKVVFS
ncbi:hypothetical protein SAMN04489724_1778 [Algoriphagus locisalis]|uniref:Uncharacterized protein n=1 Tax=Algoriphagus locisalis TaxID=305507 RepID=A0A1I7A992_9BACT|nr:hypothetical protein [Algoriphagus locisalis]SFT71521.1 hypothetical protein SAMN04489724_1778 [Algoriphagus locisalis]